ncbi:hypothetical protein C0J52_19539, partial [Blattella germanica]
ESAGSAALARVRPLHSKSFAHSFNFLDAKFDGGSLEITLLDSNPPIPGDIHSKAVLILAKFTAELLGDTRLSLPVVCIMAKKKQLSNDLKQTIVNLALRGKSLREIGTTVNKSHATVHIPVTPVIHVEISYLVFSQIKSPAELCIMLTVNLTLFGSITAVSKSVLLHLFVSPNHMAQLFESTSDRYRNVIQSTIHFASLLSLPPDLMIIRLIWYYT